MVLDDLYCGNIYPAEQVVPHEKEYRKLHRHTGELLTELEEKLSKEQMKLVNQFHTHIIDVHCMELEAQFQYGFSLGMMLMKEVYELLKHHHNNGSPRLLIFKNKEFLDNRKHRLSNQILYCPFEFDKFAKFPPNILHPIKNNDILDKMG